jgi:hypothetical protein
MINMAKTQSVLRRSWKIIGGFVTLLTIVLYLAQINEYIDLNQLLLPLYNFLINSIPVYYLFLILFIFIILFYLIKLIKKGQPSNILDSIYGRRVAILCQTPKTTQQLREDYENWKSQSSWIFFGGYAFDDYMKDLEKQGYIKYVNKEWKVTQKALEYIRKYHGG